MNFDQICWHDNRIHAIAFDKDHCQLLLYIDYICKWVVKKKLFLFWVAPATLLFRNVHNINISNDTTDFVILEISRSKPEEPQNHSDIDEQVEYLWDIETSAGQITFKSVGYMQFIRNNPILIKRQLLSLSERGVVSFTTNEQ